MADAPAPASGAPARGGFGSRGGDRGRGRGRGRGRRGGRQNEEKEWQPVTKLGRLVKAGKIKSMEEIYLHSLPIKEFQIIDFFLPKLKDEVMKVSSYTNFFSRMDCGGIGHRGKLGFGGHCEHVWRNTRKWACLGTFLGMRRLMHLGTTDQARPEADPCRSAHPLQGHRRHW